MAKLVINWALKRIQPSKSIDCNWFSSLHSVFVAENGYNRTENNSHKEIWIPEFLHYYFFYNLIQTTDDLKKNN